MAGCTCIWLNEDSTISIGSSMVYTVDRRRGQLLERGVEGRRFPEPVGPVTRMMPLGLSDMACQCLRSSSEKPSSVKLRTSTSGSKMRITSFSPKAVGSVDRRNSASSPSAVRVLMRPSCGRRFDQVHAPEDLDAADHGGHHAHRDLVCT